MIYFFMPIALLILPYCALRCMEGYRHSFIIALVYIVASIFVLYLLLIFDNGFDAPDSLANARLLAPYFILSIPLTIATIGVVGFVRNIDKK